MRNNWSGVFAIPVTPFMPDLSVDTDSFLRQVRFCIECGAQGIVYPGVVSEFFTLDLEERRMLLELLCVEAAGELPVVAGVTAPSSPYAVKLAQHAREVGADGVMTMLPFVHHFFAPDQEFAVRHLRMVAGAGLPIIFQNARIGYPLPVGQLPLLVEAVPGIKAVKEETSPSTHRLGSAIEALRGLDVDTFGGIGGVYLIDELTRGAAGTMPAPGILDIIVDAYTSFTRGEVEAARDLLSTAAPLFTYELLYNVGVIKQVLVRRGVIGHASCRVPAPSMDEVDERELHTMMERLAPYFRTALG